MIDFKKTWAVASAELRLTRRLKRYWVFVALAYVLAIGFYIYYSILHGVIGQFSATVAMIGPHFLFGIIGIYYLTGFTLAFIFLGFDVRAREVREGVQEVLDARPITNVELVAGKFLGLFLAAWIPILILTLLIQGLGWLLVMLGSPIGDTLEMRSLFTFAVYFAVPALAFSYASVFLITLLVRNRLLAAVLSIGVIYGLFALVVVAPPTLAAFVDFIGLSQFAMASDIIPSIARDATGWAQRCGVLLVALGMIGLAAAIHPRLDGGQRWMQSLGGAGIVGAGIALLAVNYVITAGQVDQVDRWLAAHQQRAADPAPDIVSMRGDVAIFPGDTLTASLEVVLRAPEERALQSVLLTLNPGLSVSGIMAANGQTLSATQADGLLEIALPQPLRAGEEMQLSLTYAGAPDPAFGYLDSAFSLEKSNVMNGNVGMLGYLRGIFDARFVALMPGIRWLPAAGADVDRDDTRTRPRDYYDVALTVDVPADWTPAGPGRRQEVAGGSAGRAVYRFAPPVPVPEVALLASRFEGYSAEIGGVIFEVLVVPQHTQNLEFFANASDAIQSWVGESLARTRDAGLPYPYDALTLVEVPFALRSYEGGWRMDSAFAPPAMLLMREAGFPTASFDILAIQENARRANDADALTEEEQIANMKRDRLIQFATNDFTGSNPFIGAARSYFGHQTSATGPAALALNHMLAELTTLVVSERRGYFSAHLFDASMNARIGEIVANYQLRRPRNLTIADVVINTLGSRPEVWDHVLESSLIDIDPDEAPQKTIDILTLKAGSMAQFLYQQLGADRSARVLGDLVTAHRGASFTLDDVIAAVDAAGMEDARQSLADWLHTTKLPGFVAEEVEFYRLDDDELGNPQYQLLVRLRNDEPVPGTVRVFLTESTREDNQINEQEWRLVAGDSIRMAGQSAVQVGMVMSKIPISVYVEPTLSLNRGSFIVFSDFYRTKEYGKPDEPRAPVRGVASIPWDPQGSRYVIVDDLDPGFAVVEAEDTGELRLGNRTVEGDTDQGLPSVFSEGANPNQWSRAPTATAWGRYRHTIAYMRPGDGETKAAFTAAVPEGGAWQLEIYLPDLVFNNNITTWGTWQLEIINNGDTQTLSFDTSAGFNSWNRIGEFNLAAGEVTVALSDQSDGRLVVADAIRWSPRARNTTMSAASANP